eukprot:NODE_169_length_14535_cov_0.769881.p11 type:complete len:101 gc:universal NODE_169_length_14535_cov_0.769881:6811-7113(+)
MSFKSKPVRVFTLQYRRRKCHFTTSDICSKRFTKSSKCDMPMRRKWCAISFSTFEHFGSFSFFNCRNFSTSGFNVAINVDVFLNSCNRFKSIFFLSKQTL